MAHTPSLPVNAPNLGKRFSQGQQRPRRKNLGLLMFQRPWAGIDGAPGTAARGSGLDQ